MPIVKLLTDAMLGLRQNRLVPQRRRQDAPRQPAESFLTDTRAIVLIIDAQADDPVDPALVRDVLGLTLGEARVASLLVRDPEKWEPVFG